jgi:hypothetical protein
MENLEKLMKRNAYGTDLDGEIISVRLLKFDDQL